MNVHLDGRFLATIREMERQDAELDAQVAELRFALHRYWRREIADAARRGSAMARLNETLESRSRP